MRARGGECAVVSVQCVRRCGRRDRAWGGVGVGHTVVVIRVKRTALLVPASGV